MGRPKSIMTKVVEKYIDENWKTQQYKDIAEHLGIGKTTISNYCIKKGYKKRTLDRNQDIPVVG